MSSHKSVVRNQGYTRAAVGHIERHNERKNENYSNLDVILEQSHNNVHFKICDGTYLGVFDKMVTDGELSTRGLKLNNEGTKPESGIIAEMVFDVNTEYFEEQYASHGHANAYDFAKAFYAEAYRMAVAEVGDEKYILGAVLHADERNKGLSEKLGRDVYHYHLHVTYIPVVRKEILWTKRCKDPTLVGTIKEVISQVNHSKKWESEKEIGEDGKEKLVYSYSKLQDRYHDHMKSAGYSGFDRGKEGSTAKHLSVLEYKAKLRQEELAEKEKELAAAEKALHGKSEKLADTEAQLTAFDEKIGQKVKRVEKLEDKEKGIQERIKAQEDGGQILTLKQLESMPRKLHYPVIGSRGVLLSEKDEKNLRAMAMSAAKVNEENKSLKNARKTAYETIRDIVQAVCLLKFRFLDAERPVVQNLSSEQIFLIESIISHGKEFVKNYGYSKLADEMKSAKLDGAILEIFYQLTNEAKAKTQKEIPALSEMIESAQARSKEREELRRASSTATQGRKSRGEER